MGKVRSFLLGSLMCFVVAFASADSVNPIAITGTTYDGFATTAGDFNIQGTGLNLYQALPNGPSSIGFCTVGTVCNFSWSPVSASSFCSYCTGYSLGSVGSSVAQYLSPDLVFKGSAFYSGGDSLTMQFTVTGTITGYELINCTSGVSCSLGPKEFTVNISGHGTETLTMNNFGNSQVAITGLSGTFTGTATPVTTPEPASVFLMGTGLAGVWMKRRKRL